MSRQATIQVENGMLSEASFFVSSRSRAMKNLENVATEIAGTGISVLIAGENGTGKQVLARMIHENSPRRGTAPLRVVCGILTADTMGSQLRQRGRKTPFDGTVILDELGELDRESQRKLLHMLPDGESSAREVLTARVISTTSQNLEEEVRAGRFRSDLFYRLNGICLRIPPLRERPEDVGPLVEFFLTKLATQLGKAVPVLSASAMARLNEHMWSGNIRELENVAMKIVALGDEQIALADLCGPENGARLEPLTCGHSLKVAARAASREAERELILKALAHTRWNRKRAAEELQISYKSLLYKLKQIGLPNLDSR
jgi:two-component system response regulator AtoC